MIGKRLYQLRKEYNMTQQELADRLNLSKYAISSYENTNTSPKDELKVEIARIFNVSLDYLLGLIDTPLPYSRDENEVLVYPPNFSDKNKEEAQSFVGYLHRKKEPKRQPRKLETV